MKTKPGEAILMTLTHKGRLNMKNHLVNTCEHFFNGKGQRKSAGACAAVAGGAALEGRRDGTKGYLPSGGENKMSTAKFVWLRPGACS